jgi:tRNA-specific 2-thiouridylase
MTTRKAKAVALYSGGLDSTLAILVMMRHGIEIKAIKFLTHFGCDIGDSSSCGSDPYPASEQFGFEVKLSHLGQKFVDMVKSPRFGYGKNMNPCIDCRLLMLQEAKLYMEMTKADFIITGEVLAQRPMSQMRGTLNMISGESELGGKLVRPLSGRLLPPTVPEIEGLIKREWLLDIAGRSRRRQMDLAAEFGLTKYPTPAGGCLLTEIPYSKKLRDLFTFEENYTFDDINLLKIGRHFRLSHNVRLIIGRQESENDIISGLVRSTDYVLEVLNVGSPIGLLKGPAEKAHFELAAALTARYCDSKKQEWVSVNIKNGDKSWDIAVAPLSDSMLEKYRI